MNDQRPTNILTVKSAALNCMIFLIFNLFTAVIFGQNNKNQPPTDLSLNEIVTVGIAEKAILRVTSPVLNNDVSKFKIDFGFADGESIQKYPKNFLQVFNRWGTRVYHEKGYNHNWDGSTTGLATMGSERKLPIGTYYYILDLGDGTTNQKLGWLYISK